MLVAPLDLVVADAGASGSPGVRPTLPCRVALEQEASPRNNAPMHQHVKTVSVRSSWGRVRAARATLAAINGRDARGPWRGRPRQRAPASWAAPFFSGMPWTSADRSAP